MIVFEITIAIFLAAILGSALARRFQLPLELTLLVGSLAVALVPSLPLVIGYLPPRLGRAREAAALRRLLIEGAGNPALERFLAQRAVEHLSYRELRRVSATPWRDVEDGRYSSLADAELARLGLRRPRPAVRAPRPG